ISVDSINASALRSTITVLDRGRAGERHRHWYRYSCQLLHPSWAAGDGGWGNELISPLTLNILVELARSVQSCDGCPQPIAELHHARHIGIRVGVGQQLAQAGSDHGGGDLLSGVERLVAVVAGLLRFAGQEPYSRQLDPAECLVPAFTLTDLGEDE